MHFSPPPSGFGCCPFQGGGSVVVDSLLIVTPIVGFCYCSVLLCLTLCPFLFCNGEERVGYFALFVVIVVRLFLAMPRVCLQFVIVVFLGHTNFFKFRNCYVIYCRLLCVIWV